MTDEARTELQSELRAHPQTLAMFRTDGAGRPLQEGATPDDARRVDLAIAALRRLGATHALGAPATLLLECRDAVLVAGCTPRGENVVLVATPGANVGLLLSKMRRLLALEAPVEK